MQHIQIVGKFFDNHSLSIINRNVALKLHNSEDYNISIVPTDSYNPAYKLRKEDVKILRDLISITNDIPDLQLRHSYPPIWRWPVSKKTKIAYIQPWEFSKVPSEWAYKFEQFADALIVPSNWNAERYLESGLNPKSVYVVPNGYNPEIFHKSEKKSNSKFTVIFVGNSQYRKGADILLAVWHKVFKKADNIHLIVKDNPSVYGNNNLIEEIVRLQYKTNCGEVTYIDEDYSEEEMAKLYQSADLIVHPHRGEAFGMHLQEAMACGAIPVVSAYGGVLDFINEKNGELIPTSQKVIDLTDNRIFAIKPGDSLSQMGQHSWIEELDANKLARTLHSLYNGRDYIENKKSQWTSPLNTWEIVSQKYIEVFKEILSKEGTRRNG